MQMMKNFRAFAMAQGAGLADRYRQLMNRGDRTPAYHAEASEDGKTAEMHLYDVIGDEWFGCIGAKTVAKFLDAHGDLEELTLRINSPGGDVFEGMAIYNKLRDHKALVNVYIDGVAASIASVIAMCGDEIHIGSNASMFIHNPWGCMCGESDDFEKAANILNTMKQQIVNTYAARSGASEDDIVKMMDDETYLTAEDAKAKGFVDSVEPLKLRAAAFADHPMFAALKESVSDEHKAELDAVAQGQDGEEGAGSQEPETGEENKEETPDESGEEAAGGEPETPDETQDDPEEPAGEPEEEPTDPKAQLKKYINAFGAEKGSTWFADGVSFADAMMQHNRDLMAENAKLTEQIRQAKGLDDEEPPVGSDPTQNDPDAAAAARKEALNQKGVGGGVAALAASMKFASK